VNKLLTVAAILAALALAADKKAADKKPAGPAEGSADDLAFSATPILDRDEITQALGADLGEGFVVVHIKASPKGEKTIHVSPDDFTLLSRKDGERSPALAPAQIAGRGGITVKAAKDQPSSWGTKAANGPIWGGIGAAPPRSTTAPPTVMNTEKTDPGKVDTAPAGKTSGDSTLLGALKAKIVPETDTKDPVEGLLYFRMDGKNKLKDLSLLYKGDGGRAVADFK
jgi:hypothetical protein